jgi:hypothetical protein
MVAKSTTNYGKASGSFTRWSQVAHSLAAVRLFPLSRGLGAKVRTIGAIFRNKNKKGSATGEGQVAKEFCNVCFLIICPNKSASLQ